MHASYIYSQNVPQTKSVDNNARLTVTLQSVRQRAPSPQPDLPGRMPLDFDALIVMKEQACASIRLLVLYGSEYV
jgi:hypothetical protein